MFYRMRPTFLFILIIWHAYAEKNETIKEDPPDANKTDQKLILKDSTRPSNINYDQGVDSKFPVVSKIATKDRKIAGGYGKMVFDFFFLKYMIVQEAGNFGPQPISLVKAARPSAIRLRKPKGVDGAEKDGNKGKSMGIVKGYFSSAYQQGYSGKRTLFYSLILHSRNTRCPNPIDKKWLPRVDDQRLPRGYDSSRIPRHQKRIWFFIWCFVRKFP